MSQSINHPLVYNYSPATFVERGVAAPFTSPILAGARLRRARSGDLLSADARASGALLEVIVPTWAGGRGVYVVPWSDIRQMVRPTVHDIRVGESLVGLLRSREELRPADVRLVAREAARDGFAGRRAAAAAAESTVRAQLREDRAIEALTERLSRQMALGLPGQAPAGAVIERAALAMCCAPGHLRSLLDDVCARAALIGLGVERIDAPIPKLLALVARTAHETAEWSRRSAGTGHAGALQLLANAETTIALAEKVVADTRAALEDVPALVRSGLADRARTLRDLERADWITDGWERICLLWQAGAASAARPDILHEISALVPQWPDELDRWLQLAPGTSAALCARTRAGKGPAPPSALALEVIARNEHIRARAA